jgi:hypothetical protein
MIQALDRVYVGNKAEFFLRIGTLNGTHHGAEILHFSVQQNFITFQTVLAAMKQGLCQQ